MTNINIEKGIIMFTTIMAWINSKSNCEYSLIFLGTFIIDMTLIESFIGGVQ
jgi:hypothetical protein